MNILTFDIEEWYLEKTYGNGDKLKYEAYDNMLGRILDLLDAHSIKATFFCLGALCGQFSDVIKRIAFHGHEIGCHSNTHRWINKMTPGEFRQDTRDAISALQDLTGTKIISYRAPAFSIGESNKWAFEILGECGIENDASIFPGNRDFGGFPTFSSYNNSCKLDCNGIIINEFPISMTTMPMIGKPIAYSGGGYFRLLPLSFIKSRMSKSEYVMCYFHIADLIDYQTKLMTKEAYEIYFKEEGSLKNRIIRYAKSNVGRKHSFNCLENLLDNFDFIPIVQASLNSNNFPLVKI